MHRYVYSFILVILTATLLAACGSGDKGPAETALKAAEEAINTAKGEASKYMPDQVKSLETELAATREKLSKADYKAVLSEAPALTSSGGGDQEPRRHPIAEQKTPRGNVGGYLGPSQSRSERNHAAVDGGD